MRKKTLSRYTISVIVGAMLVYIANTQGSYYSALPAYEMSNDGFVEVDVQLDGNLLQFSSGCRAVVMPIHEVQALSIKNGIENRIDVRPLTHDMLKEILEGFDVKVLEVRVEAFENEIYTAKTFVRQGNRIMDIDTRPSDAVGIAVRTGASVYFSEQLLESKGVNTCG